jgi:hypothetical protein
LRCEYEIMFEYGMMIEMWIRNEVRNVLW